MTTTNSRKNTNTNVNTFASITTVPEKTANPEAILPDYYYAPKQVEKGLYEFLLNLRWRITKSEINSLHSLSVQALIDLMNIYHVIEREFVLQGFTWESDPWLSADITAFNKWISTFFNKLYNNLTAGRTDDKFFKLWVFYRLEEWQAEAGFVISSLPEKLCLNDDGIITHYYHCLEITLERFKQFHVK